MYRSTQLFLARVSFLIFHRSPSRLDFKSLTNSESKLFGVTSNLLNVSSNVEQKHDQNRMFWNSKGKVSQQQVKQSDSSKVATDEEIDPNVCSFKEERQPDIADSRKLDKLEKKVPDEIAGQPREQFPKRHSASHVSHFANNGLANSAIRRSKRIAGVISKRAEGIKYIETGRTTPCIDTKEKVMKKTDRSFTGVKLRKRVIPEVVLQEYEFSDNAESNVHSTKRQGNFKSESKFVRRGAKGKTQHTASTKMAQRELRTKTISSTRARKLTEKSMGVDRKKSIRHTDRNKEPKWNTVGRFYPKRRSSRIKKHISTGKTDEAGTRQQGIYEDKPEALDSSFV